MLCFHCREMVATFFLRELIAPSEMQPGTTRCDVTLARNACLFVAKCFLRPLSFLRDDKENLLPRLLSGGDCRFV